MPSAVTTPRTVGGPPRASSTERVAVLRQGRPEVGQFELVGCSTGKSPDPRRCKACFPPLPDSAVSRAGAFQRGRTLCGAAALVTVYVLWLNRAEVALGGVGGQRTNRRRVWAFRLV